MKETILESGGRVQHCPDCGAPTELIRANGTVARFTKHDTESCRQGILMKLRATTRLYDMAVGERGRLERECYRWRKEAERLEYEALCRVERDEEERE